MLSHLKKYKASLLLLLFMLSLCITSRQLISHNDQQIQLLHHEIDKINQQNLSFLKQSRSLLLQKQHLEEQFVQFYANEKILDTHNIEKIQQLLLITELSNDVLSILPPSEIALLLKNHYLENIQENLFNFQQLSQHFIQNVRSLNNEQYSYSAFHVGNIKNVSLKNVLHNNITQLVEQQNLIFQSFFSMDNHIDMINHYTDQFINTTDKLSTAYPTIVTYQNTNKKFINDYILSLSHSNDYLLYLFVFSIIGLLLSVLLLFRSIKKQSLFLATDNKKSTNESMDNNASHFVNSSIISNNLDQSHVNSDNMSQSIVEINFYETILSSVHHLNETFNKNIQVYFDMAKFEIFTKEQQAHIIPISLEFIRFSMLYSFADVKEGNILLSFQDNSQKPLFVFQDNGQSLTIDTMKKIIKQQYFVDDSIFKNKTEDQIYSFIFKPGFQLLSQPHNSDTIQLHIVAQFAQFMNCHMSFSSQNYYGNQFIIHF